MSSKMFFDEILKRANSWSMEGDVKILQWMENISRNMETQVQKMTQSMMALDGRIRDVTVALDNTNNALIALQSGNQFVESCIQEDDDLVEKNVKTPQIQEEQKIPQTREKRLEAALENNVHAIEGCFHKYILEIDDSEYEEDDSAEDVPSSITYIYKPKSIYEFSPFPYNYGTPKWNNSRLVGLPEEVESDQVNERKDTYSISSSSSPTNEENNESPESTPNFQSLSRPFHLPLKSSTLNNTVADTKDLFPQLSASIKAPSQASSTSTNSLSYNNYHSLPEKILKDKANSNNQDIVVDRAKAYWSNEAGDATKKNLTNPTDMTGKILGNAFLEKQSCNGVISSSPPQSPLCTTPRRISPSDNVFDNLVREPSLINTYHGDKKHPDMNISSKPQDIATPNPINLFDDNDYQHFMNELNNQIENAEKPQIHLNEEKVESKELKGEISQHKQPATSVCLKDKLFKSFFSEDEYENDEEFLNIYQRIDHPTYKNNKNEKNDRKVENELHLPIYNGNFVVQGSTTEIEKGHEIKKEYQKPTSAYNEQKATKLFVEDEDKFDFQSKTVDEDHLEVPLVKRKVIDKGFKATFVPSKDFDVVPHTTPSTKDKGRKVYDLKSYLFLDYEPPDDDDFFESLKNSTKDKQESMKTFEEEMPIKSMISRDANIANVDRSLQPPINTTFHGLQWIVDVPPDDFDVPESNLKDTTILSPSQPNFSSNIFYDDVSETIQAINKQQLSIPMSFCVFNDEPPPIEESIESRRIEASYNRLPECNEVSRDDKKQSPRELESSNIPSNDYDSRVENRRNTFAQKHIRGNKESHEIKKVEESNTLFGQINTNLLDIKVEALLPPSIGKPIRKEEERKSSSNSKKNSEGFPQEISSESMRNSEILLNMDSSERAETGNYSYILPSYNKHRVRVSSLRKAPSRRGRTRSSHPLEANSNLNKERREKVMKLETQPNKRDNSYLSSTPVCEVPIADADMQLEIPSKITTKSTAKTSYTSLFDDDDDFDILFGIKDNKNHPNKCLQRNICSLYSSAETVSATLKVDKLIAENLKEKVFAKEGIGKADDCYSSSEKDEISLFRNTDEEKDKDYLFSEPSKTNLVVSSQGKHTASGNTADILKNTKTMSNSVSRSLFESDSEDEDSLFKSPAKPIQKKGSELGVNMQLQQKSFFSDNEDNGGDSFGGSKRKASFQTHSGSTDESVKMSMAHNITNKEIAALQDNPLADLL